MKLLRNYIIALSVLAVVTVVLAALSVTGHLNRWEQAVVSPADPMTVNRGETGSEELAKLLSKALKNAELLGERPHMEDATVLSLQTKGKGETLTGAYSLHIISMIDREAVVEDLQTGEYYRLSIADFADLLSWSGFSEVPRERVPDLDLILQKEDNEIYHSFSPNKGTLQLYTAEGTFREDAVKIEPSNGNTDITAEELPDGLQFFTEQSPNAWSLTVKKEELVHLSQSRVTAKELFLPTEAGEYTYTLTAHWDMTSLRDWYGEAEYVFKITLIEPGSQEEIPENTEEGTVDS